jgi:hypothetical protein
MSDSSTDDKKNIMDRSEIVENLVVLGETSVNTKIEEQIKNSLDKEQYFNAEEFDNGYTYEYKIVTIGVAGATIELVKTKKIINNQQSTIDDQ